MNGTMNLSLVLSIFGAISGMTGVLVSIAAYRRDAAKIIVEAVQILSSDGSQTIEIEVRNEGRRRTLLTGIGLLYSRPTSRLQLRRLLSAMSNQADENLLRIGTRYDELGLSDGVYEQVSLAPAEWHHVEIDLKTARSRKSDDQLCWAYAEDLTGRVYVSQSNVL